MRSLSFILFVGVLLAVGCFLDASSQPARAINCDHVCNTNRTIVICQNIGATTVPAGWTGMAYYLPQCDVKRPGGTYTYTVKVNGKKVTKTFDSWSQWDTSTEQSGSCNMIVYQGNQRMLLASADQTCPCPCTYANPPPGSLANYPGVGICGDVEGVYPGVPLTGTWIVYDLYGCH
jgi:hypothetical protein